MAQETRELTFFLAGPERRLLRALAARLPARVRSNHLTGLGVAGAVGAGAAYALSGGSPVWLGVASLLLAVNWFGDSLDGTLARVRGAERPRYGYYLDHLVDAFNTAAVGIGLGLSPFVRLELALLLVILYLTLSINIYLESHVFGVFRLGYGRLGPTEARILLVLGNMLLVAGALVPPVKPALPMAANAVAALLGAVMVVVLVARCARNLRLLARLDPLPQG